jgi:hypothetical protein
MTTTTTIHFVKNNDEMDSRSVSKLKRREVAKQLEEETLLPIDRNMTTPAWE